MIPTTPRGPDRFVRPRRGIAFQFAAVALVVVSALTATGLAWLLRPPTQEPIAAKFPGKLFEGWDKPDLVIVFTGQQYGYVQPCGCSSPQIGGLERRYNFLKLIEANGWRYAAVDLGDLPQRTGPAGLPNQQGTIKYAYSMKALKAMDYSIVGFGSNEANLGLANLLGQHALNDEPKVVATNLMDAEKNFPIEIVPWKPIDVKDAKKQNVLLRLGVVAITDPTVAERIKAVDPKLRFANSTLTLDDVVKQLEKSEVQLPILLYQGPLTRNAMKKPSEGAVACAEAYPQFPLVLCHSEHDDPPMEPVKVTTKSGSESLLITVGHKGKFVGVVGVWKTGKKESPYRFRYQRVEMTEDLLTPKDKQKDHPIVALMEEYTQKLRDDKYLERYGQVRHPLQVMAAVKGLTKPVPVEYAGSESCKKCHDDAYDVWKKSAHSHAYQTLVDAKQPKNRQYDPECIVCHTVGFGYQSGFVTAERTPTLKDVGCESCHGPSSVHVANPNDKQWQRQINPWRFMGKKKKAQAIDQMCQKCHDQDNDVTWLNNGFERKWPKVDHVTVPQDEEEKEP